MRAANASSVRALRLDGRWLVVELGARAIRPVHPPASARSTCSASSRSRCPKAPSGTDCVVVAAPPGRGLRYVGKHTLAGHLIGAAVHDAVARGVAQWKRELPNIETRNPGEPA